ncbi:MAG TPA: OmpA family protein [Mucilaginibacter sp.]|nr:OmpA family protein [Mucilaginibacter sp.]
MKTPKICLYAAMIAASALALQSCHSKKLVTKANPPAPVENKPVVEQKPAQQPQPVKQEAPVQPKADLNFTNVQFDFNSSILRTDAIQDLDHIATEMKLAPDTKFMLNGYASIEGTAAHNMALSVDRANSVKTYLVNDGISPGNLDTKGYGTANPVASNRTEKGREMNRRVEVKPQS